MTYFTFLGIFLLIPILVLLTLIWRQQPEHRTASVRLSVPSVALVIGLHVFLAVSWTTPWDNYLVATGVWWYDPALVNGMTIGYVPVEEYTFFVLQPILTGLWLVFLFPRMYQPAGEHPVASSRLRAATTLAVGVIWVISVGLLLSNFERVTYLGLELVWALPPVMVQVAFGADILRRQWRIVAFTIVSATLFLSIADSIAIGAGTWTIDPVQSTGLLLGGILPVEELVFFLLTNTLIVFGATLALSAESKLRLKALSAAFNQRSASQRFRIIESRKTQ